MTVGLATGNANAAVAAVILDADFFQLHTGDPGANGTANVSAETDRKAATFGSPSAGSVSATGSPLASWATWDAGSETITHVSLWSASTAGTFQYSFALTASKAVTNGDTLNLTSHSVSASPLAA